MHGESLLRPKNRALQNKAKQQLPVCAPYPCGRGANCDKLNGMKTILISEIFGPTIQGEGALIGRPTVFVRTGGCDFCCDFCDTLYAVLPQHKAEWTKMDAPAILAEIERLSGGAPITVTLSGGNPALQPLGELLEIGHARGHNFALETQGSKAPDWLGELDHLVLSPKPPSSKMEFSPEMLNRCLNVAGVGARATHISIKVVVFDEADFQFARRVYALHPDVPFYLSVGNDSVMTGKNADNAALDATIGMALGALRAGKMVRCDAHAAIARFAVGQQTRRVMIAWVFPHPGSHGSPPPKGHPAPGREKGEQTLRLKKFSVPSPSGSRVPFGRR